HRPVAKRHPDHEQADAVVCRVAQEIEGVRLKRRRSRCQPGADLDSEHRRIDRKNGPKHAAIGGVRLIAIKIERRRCAAAVGHAPGYSAWARRYTTTQGLFSEVRYCRKLRG